MAASRPDVIVVGGGPAGATAARTLAAAGARVLVLDKAAFPRNKPCGGAVSMRALRRFPYLDAALGRISTHRLSRLYLEAPSGDGLSLTSRTPAALMIRRIEFDDLLLALAREAGAEVVEGAEVARAHETERGVWLKTRDEREFEAPLVIAADGVNSVVARRLRFNPGWSARDVALDMMEETPADSLRSVDEDTLWVAYGYGGSEGYAYVFPKAGHVNVGIGYVLDYYRSNVEAHPWTLQRRFVDELKQRHVLAGESSRRHFTPFMIPVGGPLRRTASRRVMLAGDAGGFVNGITAEGIYYAMVSGDLAGRAAADGATAGLRARLEAGDRRGAARCRARPAPPADVPGAHRRARRGGSPGPERGRSARALRDGRGVVCVGQAGRPAAVADARPQAALRRLAVGTGRARETAAQRDSRSRRAGSSDGN